MRIRFVLLVIGLLMAGVLVAGCGGQDETTDNTGAQPATTDTGNGGSSNDSGGSGGSGGGGSASNPQTQQAVDACKQQIGAQPGISEDVKKDLEEICQKAASGDEKDVREATKQVCIKLIEENVPKGPAQDQAKASCEQATQAP